MTPIFTRHDFDNMCGLFDPDAKYKGYKPTVRERPDGDSRVDADKMFLHIALKYDPPEWAVRYLARAHFEACRIAEQAGVPTEWLPAVENATLRVLFYPVGAGTEEHADFDLLTVNCYRDTPDDIEAFTQVNDTDGDWIGGGMAWHVGELGTMCGMGPATRHRVTGKPYEQRSIVFFASPAMATKLPEPITFPAIEGFAAKTVTTTGEWQIERTARSRVTGYK
jgi:hypothetical protein